MAGLSVKPDTLSRKSTGILCNHGGIVVELSKFQCDGQHKHLHLQGGLPRKAQEYPPELVSALLRGIDGDVNFKSTNLMAEDFGNEGDPPEAMKKKKGGTLMPRAFLPHRLRGQWSGGHRPRSLLSRKRCCIVCIATWATPLGLSCS